ncbi:MULTISPECIES: hypothetical protein [unclassified Ruegeria]|uniref:hypothetical protein n=1 Tax=unclassified Ruegeria TaxID=2625375 RepID=UPI001488C159|nr:MULTISPECIES: hypothetical protein [unclassified Ruegeria]
MNFERLNRSLRAYEANQENLSQQDRIRIARLLIRTANSCLESIRQKLNEEDAASKRRKAKRQETELDPKPPIKPVRVAEPSKPKKPKYSGNHAPSAPKR